MILLLALQATTMRVSHPGDPIGAYKNCMAPIVLANERAGGKAHQPLEKIVVRIAVQCAKQRERAADALIGQILNDNPDLSPPPSDAEKERLISAASIDWTKELLARNAAGEIK